MEIRKSLAVNWANKLITKHQNNLPIDPIKYCTDILGFNIYYLEDIGLSALMVRTDKIIGVNKNEHIYRQRFSIAHEIGHFYLHENILEFKDSDTTFKDLRKPIEAEANYFASEFLMPSNLVKKEFEKCMDPDKLSHLFKVSKQAIWIKIQDLKLI